MLRPLEGGPGRSRAFSTGWLDEAGLHKLLCCVEANAEKAGENDYEHL